MSINKPNSFFSRSGAAFSNFCEKCPEIKVPKLLQSVALATGKISTPGQRAILMVSAIPTQTLIDVHNEAIDEDTRITSAARTLGKIIAGGCVGITVRALCIKALDRAIKPGGFIWIKELESLNPIQIKKYQGAIGSMFGIIVCLFTNFLLDAPIAIKLTNKFIDIFKKQDPLDKKKLDYYSSFPYPYTSVLNKKPFKGNMPAKGGKNASEA